MIKLISFVLVFVAVFSYVLFPFFWGNDTVTPQVVWNEYMSFTSMSAPSFFVDKVVGSALNLCREIPSVVFDLYIEVCDFISDYIYDRYFTRDPDSLESIGKNPITKKIVDWFLSFVN